MDDSQVCDQGDSKIIIVSPTEILKEVNQICKPLKTNNHFSWCKIHSSGIRNFVSIV